MGKKVQKLGRGEEKGNKKKGKDHEKKMYDDSQRGGYQNLNVDDGERLLHDKIVHKFQYQQGHQ